MKVLRQDRNTVCFIEFDVSGCDGLIIYVHATTLFPYCVSNLCDLQNVSAASAVHHTLQGAVVPSSGRGGMRIQYPLLVYNLVHVLTT